MILLNICFKNPFLTVIFLTLPGVIGNIHVLVNFSFLTSAGTVIPMLESVVDVVPIENLAVHFHDTYGQALSNILLSLQVISVFSILVLIGWNLLV